MYEILAQLKSFLAVLFLKRSEQCFHHVAIDGEFSVTMNIKEEAECYSVEIT